MARRWWRSGCSTKKANARDKKIIVELMPPVIGTYIELLGDLSQPLAHDQPVFGGMFWLSEKRFSGS
jgi:hypothetical protein